MVKWKNNVIKILAVLSFITASHLWYDNGELSTVDPVLASQWRAFHSQYKIAEFGDDGYFVRAIEHGHALINQTYRYAWRFTRTTENGPIHACAQCHRPEDLAYAFVNSDRYDSVLKKRVSFEERIMRCYVKQLDGFVPTIYDPAIRDIRIYARAVAHHLQLSEGALVADQR